MKFVEAKTGKLFKKANSLSEIGSDGKSITKQLELFSDFKKAGGKGSYEIVTPYNLKKGLKDDIIKKADELGVNTRDITFKRSK